MSEQNKSKLGNFLCVAIIIITALLAFGMVAGSNLMGWLLIAVNIISSPICFLLYLNEIRKGVFKNDSDNEIEE